jgi:hypothetical protein
LRAFAQTIAADSDTPERPHFVWREYVSRHYATEDGEYDSNHKGRICGWAITNQTINARYVSTSGKDRQWQNQVADEYLNPLGVPILPLWRASFLVGPQAHPGNGDCTHYVTPDIIRYNNQVLILHIMHLVVK